MKWDHKYALGSGALLATYGWLLDGPETAAAFGAVAIFFAYGCDLLGILQP